MIEVRNLVKQFGEFTAVDDVSFDVAAGKIFGFLGPNGAGKTTTIKMMTTVLRPTSGEIRINGHDPLRDMRAVRKSFGIVFQDPSLDGEMTTLENLEFHGVLYGVPTALRKERTESLLKLVELSERRNAFVKTFSGGMKRRLEIARALLHAPRIIFLDEPTLGLDPQTRNHIWNYIRTLVKTQDITVFFTTHYMEEADRVADEVAIIDKGRIIARDTPAALKQAAGTATLEDAFISLTGHTIRDEEASASDRMRAFRQVWRGNR